MPLISSTTSAYGYGRNAVLDYDIFFKKTVLLLHMNGGNGSTNFIDSSLYNKSVNVFGSAQISTAQSQFGGSSGYFNNIDAYLTVDNDSTLDFTTGDWTIEFFCRIDPVETDILLNKADEFGFYGYQLRIINDRFSMKGYSADTIPELVYELGEDVGPVIIPATWYHIAAARQSNNFWLYINGQLIDSTNSNKNLYNSRGSLSIGGTNNGQGLTSGYIDELRITKGICRYPNGANFPVPQNEFFND